MCNKHAHTRTLTHSPTQINTHKVCQIFTHLNDCLRDKEPFHLSSLSFIENMTDSETRTKRRGTGSRRRGESFDGPIDNLIDTCYLMTPTIFY